MICDYDGWFGTDYCKAGKNLNRFGKNIYFVFAENILRFTLITNYEIFVLGPDTKDFSWSDWGEWSECSVACGGVGSQSRVRSCIPPTNGGYECPSDTDSESQDCNNGPCPGEQFLNYFHF